MIKYLISFLLLLPITNIDSVNTKITNLIKSYEQILIDDYQHNDNEKYDLNVAYDTYNYKDINSLMITVSYYNGGANYSIEQYSFYYNNKEELQLDDIFKGNYLERISELTYKKLQEKKLRLFDDETVKLNTSPKKENFKHLYLTDEGLKVILEYYQVGPRYLGNIEILIPYSEIKDILSLT